MAKNNDEHMKKSLGFGATLSTVAGTIIGTGVFFKASAVTTATMSISLALFAWFLGGIINMCARLTAAEVAAAFPETGGIVKYIEEPFGKFWGFLTGWAYGIVYMPANVAAIAIAFGTQFAGLFHLADSWIVPVGMITALSVALLNFISAKCGGWVSSVTLVIKLLPLAAIVILGFLHPGGVDFRLFPIEAGPHRALWAALGTALLATMFAYDGWIHVGTLAGEMKNPQKDLPKAIAVGLLIVITVYLLVNAVFYYVVPVNQVAGNLNVSMDVADKIFGGVGGKIVTIGILVSVYGGMNGYTMTGMRVPYVMGQEKTLPFSNFFAKLNKAGVPWASGLVQYIIACLMMLSGQFDAITNMLIFVIWFFYCMVFIGVMKMRKTRPDLKRPYKVPLYPVIPLIALVGGAFILISTLIQQFTTTAIGIVITLIGVPIYFYMQKKNAKVEH